MSSGWVKSDLTILLVYCHLWLSQYSSCKQNFLLFPLSSHEKEGLSWSCVCAGLRRCGAAIMADRAGISLGHLPSSLCWLWAYSARTCPEFICPRPLSWLNPRHFRHVMVKTCHNSEFCYGLGTSLYWLGLNNPSMGSG